jgi:putative DNA primase/helicase
MKTRGPSSSDEINKATRRGERKTKAQPQANGAAHADAEPTGESAPNEWEAFGLEIERLAKLNILAYQRERKDIAARFNAPLPFLDKQVEAARKSPKSEGLPEIVPWPRPVDGVQLLDELAAIFRHHVVVPTRAEDAVALWVVHTHCLDATDISPRLQIGSATPECGKSTLLKLVNDLVPRPIKADGATAAAIYRAVKMWQPTLLLDEADTYLRDNEALRGVLDSGHERGGTRLVCDTDDNVPTLFPTWCAMAIALIGKPHATIASRCVLIELQRLLKGQQVERYRRNKQPYADTRRKIARWSEDNVVALRDADPDMEDINRRADNWRPLFAIADRVGGHWAGPTGKAREAAATLTQPDAGQTTAVMLLADIRSILVDLGNSDRVQSAELAKKLNEMEGRPWPEYGRSGKPITTNAIARLLKPFHVAPDKIRFTNPKDGLGETAQGYWVGPLQHVFDRYLPPLS